MAQKPTPEELGRERFGADYMTAADYHAPTQPCPECGKPTLHGRHLNGQKCTPCLRCKRIGLKAEFPCVHSRNGVHVYPERLEGSWLVEERG